jgi:hypothetical protein
MQPSHPLSLPTAPLCTEYCMLYTPASWWHCPVWNKSVAATYFHHYSRPRYKFNEPEPPASSPPLLKNIRGKNRSKSNSVRNYFHFHLHFIASLLHHSIFLTVYSTVGLNSAARGDLQFSSSFWQCPMWVWNVRQHWRQKQRLSCIVIFSSEYNTQSQVSGHGIIV